ncbi:MAG: hypothetical protein SGJ04_08810 [Bacteroidota bacterium]|nr:hypothetical protein [Bacteroidota bacterium]
MEITDIEFAVLGAVYFVEPFEKILEEVPFSKPIVADALKMMIDRGYITPMVWDDERSLHVRTFFYDTDNMDAYFYQATRAGLIVHTSL